VELHAEREVIFYCIKLGLSEWRIKNSATKN